ncbi:hypothetical protein BT96DRAFT_1027124 [Gymnopus androsaceus JB14]|uniref:DDE Tnp4 domain-containing protein n=1 Tax=Gymnopus androsaceus JB14 TaxID=1447944 RepID=A0A6A4GDY0_9AGAR|nr:hypothetical protein BT96DRAFT_1027124 [Gymnopus androsaceus JB14]
MDVILQRQQEEDLDDEAHLQQLALLATLFLGIAENEQNKVRRRNPSRLYLRRHQLMPFPRLDSPWQRLWAAQDDRSFITTMGFDVRTFRYILEGRNRFAERWNNTPIPRNDVSSQAGPRIHARSLDAAGALGLVLHYLSSSMLEITLQQVFALVPSVLTRYLDFAKQILLQTLRSMPEAQIKLPRNLDEFQANSDLITARHSQLEGGFGSIDGLSLPTEVSDDVEMENATYNGWKSEHRINNVFVFSPQGLIIDASLNAPGSWHDAHVSRRIFERLRTRVPEGYYLIADTAFPRGDDSISGKIRAPVKAGECIPANPTEQEQFMAFNRQLLSFRQTAEWGMRALQGAFGRLRVPLPINDPRGRLLLLEIIARLFNVWTVCVGINQIRNVYEPIWHASEDEQLWNTLGDMVFGEIRKRDRVSRFHVVAVPDT